MFNVALWVCLRLKARDLNLLLGSARKEDSHDAYLKVQNVAPF